MRRYGKLIYIEGPDGAGKTTQAKLVERELEKCGYRVFPIREPGGTRVSEHIRAILLDPNCSNMSDRTELFLFEAARAQIYDELVVPVMRGEYKFIYKGQAFYLKKIKNKIAIVSDRGRFSSLGYQGFARGLSIDEIVRQNPFATQGIKPDLSVIIDIPAKTGLRRARRKSGKGDRIEQEDVKFHERV
ncbi:dTMP kinase, partial [Candidatus Woesearchaeota archaeon]|nr:dTMP kinase [Candidatus Woesearchaeota archaeon]